MEKNKRDSHMQGSVLIKTTKQHDCFMGTPLNIYFILFFSLMTDGQTDRQVLVIGSGLLFRLNTLKKQPHLYTTYQNKHRCVQF